MICTFYSNNTGFDRILEMVTQVYPSCKIELSKDEDFQVATIIIKRGFLKSAKKIKIPYRQVKNPSQQLSESDHSELAENIRGLYGCVKSLPATNEKVRVLFLRKILSVNAEFSIIEQQGETKDIETLIQAVALNFDAILFVQPNTTISKSASQHFLDKNLNLIIDGDGNCEIEDLEVIVNTDYSDAVDAEVTAEQIARKEKSEQILGEKNIKINKNLPCIESENETIIRTAKEIAQRLSVIAVTNHVAFNVIDGDEAIEFLKEHKLWDLVTDDEKSFLADPTPEKKRTETWKCEAIWVLMWALKKVDQLDFPDHLCNLNDIPYQDYPNGKDKDPNDFINQTWEPRSKREILDANDFYYRVHWACVDARLNNGTMDEVNADVVYERHYALNWLINYMDQEWDNVSCDT